MTKAARFSKYGGWFAGGLIAASVSSAFAQGADPAASYPSRPVTMVTPFAPGASVDLEGRIFSNELAKALGQPFVMDFKPGGTMAVGMTHALRQKPDGHTLVWVSSAYAILPLIVKDGSYDPVKDFEQVSLMTRRYAVLCVPNDLPAKNLKEFIAYAKARPGELNFGTGGGGGVQHLQGLMLESAAGIKFTYVHYKGLGASYPDLMSGRTHIVPVTFSAAVPMIKGGKMRPIALSATERNTVLPEVPTALEQGVNWEYASWLGLIAPAKTPTAIINKVQGELAKIVRLPEVRQKFGDDTTLVASTPAEFKKHFLGESGRWRKLVAESGITLSAN